MILAFQTGRSLPEQIELDIVARFGTLEEVFAMADRCQHIGSLTHGLEGRIGT